MSVAAHRFLLVELSPLWSGPRPRSPQGTLRVHVGCPGASVNGAAAFVLAGFNLQGFPADYKLPKISNSALYKLAGNAVSVPIVKLIVDKLVNVI